MKEKKNPFMLSQNISNLASKYQHEEETVKSKSNSS